MMVWIPHENGRGLLGELPSGVSVEVYPGPVGGADPSPPGDPGTVVFWVPPFLAQGRVVGLTRRMPELRVVQLLTAGADAWVGRLPDAVTLCDASGVHDSATSEWVMAAILAHLRDFPAFVRAQSRREWSYQTYAPTDELAGKRVLVVGAGSIGQALAARLAPFEVEVVWVARRARDGVHAVHELPDLLPRADVVVLIVPLTAQTEGMVDAGFLRRVPDGALLVNAARGPVVDTAALTKELATGRIAAALDVVEPEPLPAEHPLWTMPNALLTPHVAGSVRGFLPRAYRLVGEQLRRYCAGQPLVNQVADGY
ncbi:MAG TPA: 2-hydroxyacid dehydrogenase [Micromonosporaceae bacterium]|nr:2-hydroxyacid dehydrogenase [Micromonosporaceae bacterium]